MLLINNYQIHGFAKFLQETEAQRFLVLCSCCYVLPLVCLWEVCPLLADCVASSCLRLPAFHSWHAGVTAERFLLIHPSLPILVHQLWPSYYRTALTGVIQLTSRVPCAGATLSPVRSKVQPWEGGAPSNYWLCFFPSAIGYSLEFSALASQQLILCK